jgi:hypothetical protein
MEPVSRIRRRRSRRAVAQARSRRCAVGAAMAVTAMAVVVTGLSRR